MPLNFKQHLVTFVDTFKKLDVPVEEIAMALRDQADMLELDKSRSANHIESWEDHFDKG